MMKQPSTQVFDKTATFYKPEEFRNDDQKQSRYIKSNGRMFDFQLKVQGKKIVQKSQPSTIDTNLQQNKTSSTIQNEQFTPPQKKTNIARKGSVIQIRSDDKIIANRIQSSNLYTKASYEFPLRAIEYREVSFGNHNAQEIMDEVVPSRKNSNRLISKKTIEDFPKPAQSQPQPTEPTKKQPIKPKNISPTNIQLKNKLPDIFQNSSKKSLLNIQSSFAKRATSAGFGVPTKNEQIFPENEFLDHDVIPQFQSRQHLEIRLATQPSHNFQLYNNHPSVLLPSLDNGAKSRPFLQRKAQTKILDRIFSGK